MPSVRSILYLQLFYLNLTHVYSFCSLGGGFCVGWVESNKDPVMSCIYGCVSASFAVEQVGLPTCSRDAEHGEIWNSGPSARDRLELLKARFEFLPK